MNQSLIDMVFMSSSKIKLAHFRHLAEKHPLTIKNFSSTYHKVYEEPRSDSREIILHDSYLSALEQAKKARIPLDSFIFFEDTSVIINALSSEKEYPGVDIKYWMRNRSFAEVNAMISEVGGDRSVTVRSDIVLHIPRKFREQLGVNENFIVFTGKQEGHLVTEESIIETNLLYPWLDGKTFNKWFVPAGEKCSISQLDIEKADCYDFRKNAFDKIIELLTDNNYLYEVPHQRSIAFTRYPNFIIVGPTCAGKTTLAQWLVDHHGYVHFEASDFMYLSLYLRHGFETKVKIGDFAEAALNNRSDIVVSQIIRLLDSFADSPIVVSGFRAPSEVEMLSKNLCGIVFDRILINASTDIRFRRSIDRKREADSGDEDLFRKKESQQGRMGIDRFVAAEGYTELKNESTLQDCFNNFSKAFLIGNAPPVVEESDTSCLKDKFNSSNMLDAILMCLLTKCDGSDCKEYLTTSEIARVSGEILPPELLKHKDNVSRYFNQNLYPYYEVEHSLIDNKNRFRLSNTGYSLAKKILRSFQSE